MWSVRFIGSWQPILPWLPARWWLSLVLVTAWFSSGAQPGETSQKPVSFRVYTPAGQVVTPTSPGWRVGYVEDLPTRRTLWLTQPPPPERANPQSWEYNVPEEKPTQELRGVPNYPSYNVSGFFHAPTGQYVLLIGRDLLRTTTSHYCVVHERDTMRIYPEGGVGRGWDPDSLPFRPGIFRLPAYVLWADYMFTCRRPRQCPTPLLRPTPGVHTDWGAFQQPLPVVYADLVTSQQVANDAAGPNGANGPNFSLPGITPVQQRATHDTVAYYGQEPVRGWGKESTPFLLRAVQGQQVLYELRDVRPDALFEGAPRHLRAGLTDTMRTWYNLGLWLDEVTVDAEGHFWALAARRYPAITHLTLPNQPSLLEPVSCLEYGVFRLYFPGELTAQELLAKKARYWQQFYEALHSRPAEQQLVKPYLAPSSFRLKTAPARAHY